MNAVTEELDRQADKKFRAAESQNTNRESQDSTIHNEARGAQIVQTNQLSTPVLIAIFGCFALLAAVFYLVSNNHSQAIGSAVSTCNEANSFGHQAEREARVAQDQMHSLDNNLRDEINSLTVRVQVAEALIQTYGMQKHQETQ